MPRQLYVNGTAMEHSMGSWYATNVETFLRGAAARRSIEISYPQRHGSTILPLGYESGGGRIRIACTDRDQLTGESGGFPKLVENEDAVKALMLGKLLTIRDVPDTSTDVGRTNAGYVLANPDHTEYNEWFSEQTFIVQFTSPFWRDETESTVSLTTAASNAALEPLRGASAPIPDARFIAQGVAGTLTFLVTDTVTGKWVKWTGTTTTANWIRLDPLAMTAAKLSSEDWTSAGTDVSAGLAVGPGGFDISPEVLITSNITSKIRARRSWF